MLRTSHSPGYTFCPKIPERNINFEEKFYSRVIFSWEITKISSLNKRQKVKVNHIASKLEKLRGILKSVLKRLVQFCLIASLIAPMREKVRSLS